MIKNGEWSHCQIRFELKILRTKEQNTERNYLQNDQYIL